MRRLSKLRKLCKWTGLVLSLLLLVVWVGSGWWEAMCWPRGFHIRLDNGVVAISRVTVFGPELELPQNSDREVTRLSLERIIHPSAAKFGWKFGFEQMEGMHADITTLVIPLWSVVLAVSVATVFFWHRDRRFSKPGLCKQCGYEIRGLEVCPECGVGVKA